MCTLERAKAQQTERTREDTHAQAGPRSRQERPTEVHPTSSASSGKNTVQKIGSKDPVQGKTVQGSGPHGGQPDTEAPKRRRDDVDTTGSGAHRSNAKKPVTGWP